MFLVLKKSADLLENKLIKALKRTFCRLFFCTDSGATRSTVTEAEPFQNSIQSVPVNRSFFRKWLTREMFEELLSGDFFLSDRS